jgi:hypothetical protein
MVNKLMLGVIKKINKILRFSMNFNSKIVKKKVKKKMMMILKYFRIKVIFQL